MVKAHAHRAGGREAAKKKAAHKKKHEGWACKMTGCNKTFAREADLKRHQRTTKSHNAPSFQCPQCEATFTRTDALRRHQRSRHNGVVIEPEDPSYRNSRESEDEDEEDEEDEEQEEPEPGPSKSESPSRSASPVGSPDPEERSPTPPPRRVKRILSPSAVSRRANYYRPHTQIVYNRPPPPPPPPPMLIDPNYSPTPVAIPTSAARLQQPGWSPPSSALSTDGTVSSHSVSSHSGYPMPPYYPQSYYRSHLTPSVPPNPHVYSEYLAHHYPPSTLYGVSHPPLSTVTGAPPMPPPKLRPVTQSDDEDYDSSVTPSPSPERKALPVEDAEMGRTGNTDDTQTGRESNDPEAMDVDDDDKMNEAAARILVKALLQNGGGHNSQSNGIRSKSQDPEGECKQEDCKQEPPLDNPGLCPDEAAQPRPSSESDRHGLHEDKNTEVTS